MGWHWQLSHLLLTTTVAKLGLGCFYTGALWSILIEPWNVSPDSIWVSVVWILIWTLVWTKQRNSGPLENGSLKGGFLANSGSVCFRCEHDLTQLYHANQKTMHCGLNVGLHFYRKLGIISTFSQVYRVLFPRFKLLEVRHGAIGRWKLTLWYGQTEFIKQLLVTHKNTAVGNLFNDWIVEMGLLLICRNTKAK